ncbi:hypothetical protein CTI12_AA271440 [Artemisia annua]|uniref:Uncharacterized protein n=1 Tax=Artemisia annua TaxID=35608 RepID=A0A2U1NFU1_ARTAN|nr:hypothetical protein CTI12_AA271440 [Artemisia annua]
MNSRPFTQCEQSLHVDMDESDIEPTARGPSSLQRRPPKQSHNPHHRKHSFISKPWKGGSDKQGPGIVQVVKLRKIAYIREVVKDVGEDDDFTRGAWVSAVEFVNANMGIVSGCLGDIKNFRKNGKLEQVVAIIKPCTPNAPDNLTVTLKNLSRTISGTIHHKVLTDGGHYINITMRNVVKVFHKDTVLGNDSGVDGSGSVGSTTVK